MIRIKVKFFGPFRDLFGGRDRDVDLPVDDGRLRVLMERLGDTPEREKQLFQGAEAPSADIVIVKNGTPVHGPARLEISLHDGDVVAIFPFLGGG
jgi:molybdopterin converting factor small subunit